MPTGRRNHGKWLWGAISLASVLLLWSLLSLIYQRIILPSPIEVLEAVPDFWSHGYLRHVWITLAEALGGFFLGGIVAIPLGALMSRREWLEDMIAPYAVGAQAVPIVALAPLIILWFGTGLLPKILVSALVAFFPILTTTVVGFKSVDPSLHELFDIMGANQWQQWRKLDLPSALPVIFGGLRIGLTLSVIGAVVGEFAGSDRGLGFLVNYARGFFDTPLMFLALGILAAMGISFYLVLVLLERLFIPWRREI